MLNLLDTGARHKVSLVSHTWARAKAWARCRSASVLGFAMQYGQCERGDAES